MPLFFIIKAHLKTVTPVIEQQLLTHNLCSLPNISKLVEQLFLLFGYLIDNKGIKAYTGNCQKDVAVGASQINRHLNAF